MRRLEPRRHRGYLTCPDPAGTDGYWHPADLLHASQSVHRVAQKADSHTSTLHPAAADLRAASDALIAGRDLLHSYDSATLPTGSDSLWASAMTARPVTAALMRQLSRYAPHLAGLTTRLLRPGPHRTTPLVTREALDEAKQ